MKAIRLMLTVLLSLIANSALSQTCTFNQPSYTVNFGVIRGGTVGKVQSNIGLTCTSGLPYSLKIGAFISQGGNMTRTYKDSNYATQLTGASPISGTGTGSLQDIPLYFKLSRSSTTGSTFQGERVVLDVSLGAYTSTTNLTLTF